MAEPTGQDQPKLIAKRKQVAVHIRIIEVDSKKLRDLPIDNVEIRMEFDEVVATGQYLEVWFSYRAEYKPEIGHIHIKGILMAEIGERAAAKQAESWNASKQVDQSVATVLLNHINHRCGSEAIFVGKLLELPSPLMPPPVSVVSSEETPQDRAQAAQRPEAARPDSSSFRPPSSPRSTSIPGPAASPKPYSYISPFTGKKPS